VDLDEQAALFTALVEASAGRESAAPVPDVLAAAAA